MELRHLYSFVMVAETGSFSDASTRCCITQSAISQHIKALEHELSCILFIRNSHKVTLTEAGEILLKRAEAMIRMAEETRESISNANGCMQGELRIGVGSFVEPVVREAAIRMMKQYPGIRLNIEYGKACRLNKMLRDHSIDIAFSMNTAFVGEGITSSACIPFRICAVMPRTHIIASRKIVSFDDIIQHGVIVPDIGARVLTTVKKYINVDLSKLRVKAIVSSPNAAISLIKELGLITFMPKMYVDGMPDLVAIPIDGFRDNLISNAHWMQDLPMKKSASILLRIIKDDVLPYFEATERMM